jgi:hypothetical protein
VKKVWEKMWACPMFRCGCDGEGPEAGGGAGLPALLAPTYDDLLTSAATSDLHLTASQGHGRLCLGLCCPPSLCLGPPPLQLAHHQPSRRLHGELPLSLPSPHGERPWSLRSPQGEGRSPRPHKQQLAALIHTRTWQSRREMGWTLFRHSVAHRYKTVDVWVNVCKH